MDQEIMNVRLKSWIPIFEEQAASGLSKKEFCEKYEIKQSDFYKWQRQLRKGLVLENEDAKEVVKDQASNLKFFELPAPVKEENKPMEIVAKPTEVVPPATISICYEGFSIDVKGTVNEDMLTTVLKVLKNAN